MKKFVVFFVIFLIVMIAVLTGCDEQRGTGLIGHDSDFFGVWRQSEGAGSYTLGDSIRFNNNYTCDFFWSGSTLITASGNWVRYNSYNATQSAIVITLGQKETVYYYGFFDSYRTLYLREEGQTNSIYYRKQ